MYKLIFFLTLIICAQSQAILRGQDRGGGDTTCENRIKLIREDLSTWILNDGHKNLDLKGRGTSELYRKNMLEKIRKTTIQCVAQGDPGFPVVVYGVPKTCAVEVFGGESKMICDFNKVTKSSQENMYRLIHHEYATLAGFEMPNGGISDYELSNQISSYFVDEVVKRLAIKPSILTLDASVALEWFKFRYKYEDPKIQEQLKYLKRTSAGLNQKSKTHWYHGGIRVSFDSRTSDLRYIVFSAADELNETHYQGRLPFGMTFGSHRSQVIGDVNLKYIDSFKGMDGRILSDSFDAEHYSISLSYDDRLLLKSIMISYPH